MSKDNYSGKSRSTPKKNDDSAVYKILGAALLLAVSIYLMRMVANNYSTVNGLDVIYPITLTAAILFGVLAAASLVVLLVVKNSLVRQISRYVLAVSVLYALTGLLLRVYWMDYVTALTFLHAAVYCLYIVYMLYRTEFFIVSLMTVAAGALFYRYSRGFGANFPCIALAVLLLVLIAGSAYVASNASKHKGTLVLGKRKLHIFPVRFNPLVIYITCAVWLVCFVVCLIFGAAFAYYCIFAAIAYELIAAVYYTFQLH